MPLTIETNFAATAANVAADQPNETAPLSPATGSAVPAPSSSTPSCASARASLSMSASASISSSSTGIDSPSSCQSQSPLLSCSTPGHSPTHSPSRTPRHSPSHSPSHSPAHPHHTMRFASQRKPGSGSCSNASSPHRLSRKESPSTTAATGNGCHEPESRSQRLRHEINLTKELIDFDVIKGSAFFHTKPSLHDKKLMHQGFRRALFFPMYGSYWRSRMAQGAFEFATCLYLFHLGNSIAFFFFWLPTCSPLNAFEICFPYLLLLLISFEYGRVSSTLQTSEATDGTLRLYSPTKQHSNIGLNGSTNAHLHFAAAAAGMVINSPSLTSSTGTAPLSSSSNVSQSSIRSELSAAAVGVAASGVLGGVAAVSPSALSPLSPPLPPTRPRIHEGILSPTSPTSAATTGFGSESENSDSTDSDHEDSDDSSSSSENEAAQEEVDAPVSPAENAAFSNVNSNVNSTNSNSSTTNAGVQANSGNASTTSTRRRPTSSSIGSAAGYEEEKESVDHLSRRRVAVCVWENGIPRKKFMSIPELRATILVKVKATPPRMIYRKIAHASAWILAAVPVFFRLSMLCEELECLGWMYEPSAILEYLSELLITSKPHAIALQVASISTLICMSSLLATHYLASILFSALADAEVTYHRRFLYAKCFTSLTSARRSRLSNLPHFRLKNVVNIKAWISLRAGRSWLKRQGRQRVADEIVSTSFLINLCLLVVMGVQAVSSESSSGSSIPGQYLLHVEVSMWCMLSSIFMLRFMMLGSNINRKYQNTSLLLTEQMNVYLRLLVKPHKKDKLLVSNNVLKLASKLLKELNSPNKVSGITMNPLLYNITRVVLLSAFSSVASEFFGFKLKLWKMKSI